MERKRNAQNEELGVVYFISTIADYGAMDLFF